MDTPLFFSESVGKQQPTAIRSPVEILADFYRHHGVSETDLDGKIGKIREFVSAPAIPPGQETPHLADYELKYLIEKGYRL